MTIFEFAPGLYRGPRPQSFADVLQLRDQFKIAKIINLQGFVAELIQVKEEQSWCQSIEMPFRHIPLDLIRPPSLATVGAVLAEINSTTFGCAYVHCHDGVDRTGVVCMAFAVRNGLTFGTAIGQMIDRGFHLHPYAMWLHTLQMEFQK